MWYGFHSFPVQLAFSLRREALCVLALALVSGIEFGFAEEADDAALTNPRHWIWSKAHAIPKETTSEESGYFSIVEGKSVIIRDRVYF